MFVFVHFFFSFFDFIHFLSNVVLGTLFCTRKSAPTSAILRDLRIVVAYREA